MSAISRDEAMKVALVKLLKDQPDNKVRINLNDMRDALSGNWAIMGHQLNDGKEMDISLVPVDDMTIVVFVDNEPEVPSENDALRN